MARKLKMIIRMASRSSVPLKKHEKSEPDEAQQLQDNQISAESDLPR